MTLAVLCYTFTTFDNDQQSVTPRCSEQFTDAQIVGPWRDTFAKGHTHCDTHHGARHNVSVVTTESMMHAYKQGRRVRIQQRYCAQGAPRRHTHYPPTKHVARERDLSPQLLAASTESPTPAPVHAPPVISPSLCRAPTPALHECAAQHTVCSVSVPVGLPEQSPPLQGEGSPAPTARAPHCCWSCCARRVTR